MNRANQQMLAPSTPSPSGSPAPRMESPQPTTAAPTGMDVAKPTTRTQALTLEEKQERQRMHVRRSYYKKRGFIRNLKEQVEMLEKQYAQALANQPDKASLVAAAAASTPTRTLASTSSMESELMALEQLDIGGASPDVPASNEAIQAFMRLSALRDSLRDENDELKQSLTRYANFVRRVSQSIEDAYNEMETTELSPHLDVLDFCITPEECKLIAREVCEEIMQFVKSEDFQTTGMSLFGWRDKRRIIPGFVEFSVKKMYSGHSIETLAKLTWELLSSPGRLKGLYSPGMANAMGIQLVQRVDDDTVVHYRRIDRRHDAGYVSKSIYMISRVKMELGHAIVLRRCDSVRHRYERELLREMSKMDNETWHDITVWVLFEEIGENVQFTFGGRFDTDAASPQFWMLEALLLSLRWEADVIGPMVMLRCLESCFLVHTARCISFKPENILLHGDVVKIADFGLARQLPTATSMLKRSCGTLEYAAPELLRGHAYELKSDIFSLWVVLYVLLFGAFPFTVESAAALQRMERFPEDVDVRDMSCLQRDNAQWRQVSASAQDVCVNDKDRIPARDLLAHPWFESSVSPASSGEGSFGALRRDSSVVLHGIRADERELERLEDCRVKGFIELLSRGLDVIKYAKSGSRAPHLSTLSLDFVHGTNAWTARGGVLDKAAGSSTRKVTDNANTSTPATAAKRGSRVISFSDVQEIRVVHTTEAFRSIATGGRDPPAADLCVSIVATWRTLDFAVKAGAQREFLVAGLNKSLADYRVKHKQP